MDGLLMFSQVLVLIAVVVCVMGLAVSLWQTLRRPGRVDLARARGVTGRGVLYAFTLGMLPWEKPSRSLKFWSAYIRGIVFHVGAFIGLATLVGAAAHRSCGWSGCGAVGRASGVDHAGRRRGTAWP